MIRSETIKGSKRVAKGSKRGGDFGGAARPKPLTRRSERILALLPLEPLQRCQHNLVLFHPTPCPAAAPAAAAAAATTTTTTGPAAESSGHALEGAGHAGTVVREAAYPLHHLRLCVYV